MANSFLIVVLELSSSILNVNIYDLRELARSGAARLVKSLKMKEECDCYGDVDKLIVVHDKKAMYLASSDGENKLKKFNILKK